MKRYPEMKDSGVKWIGEVPEHWRCKKLGSLFTERSEKVSDKDYAPLSVARMGVVPQLETAVKTDAGDNRKLVRAGDFVINSRSDRKGSCGISDRDGSVSLINIVLVPRNQWNSAYVHYLLRSQPFSEEFYRYGRGIVADLWTTRFSEMKSILLPLPPLPEQEQIVRFLDWKVSGINRLIALRQRQIAALGELKKAVISKAVTKGLDPNAPMKDSGVKWIGEVPKGWECVIIKKVLHDRQAGAWGSDRANNDLDRICMRIADFDFEKIRFKRNIDKFTVRNYTSEQIQNLSLKYGDVLIEKSGGGTNTPVGRAVLFDLPINALYANFMERLVINKDYLNSEYFSLYLYSLYSHKMTVPYIKQTTGIQNLDLSALFSSEFIPLPPLPEQEQIVRYLDEETARIDAETDKKKQQIELLRELKTRIISDTVTGKIDVREVPIPAYEYAEEPAAAQTPSEEQEETE